jgi:predicted butyrate kinase (DUF1464 family)
MGTRAVGAVDGEVAFLAGSVTKEFVFRGGADAIAGVEHISLADLAMASDARGQLAWHALVESAVKAVAALAVSMPDGIEVVLSGRGARVQRFCDEFTRQVKATMKQATVQTMTGFAAEASHAAQGAALMADGLAGGRWSSLVAQLGIRDASGTALDHLYVITPGDARRRIGMR